jgi:tetratricopeptide (TPR) repeat protein
MPPTRVTISGRSVTEAGDPATVRFNDGPPYSIIVKLPFSEAQERELEWYFEQHLMFPFTDTIRARDAAASLTAYGEALFQQVFSGAALAPYYQALAAGPTNFAFAIEGPPAFQRVHWEALKDPALPRPFALDAPMARKNDRPATLQATPQVSPTINLLLVVARSGERQDVGYRTISRPLVEGLRQAGLRVQVDIVRPGTFRALAAHLDAATKDHGPGYYHVVHFDMHGAVLAHADVAKGVAANRYTFHQNYGPQQPPPYHGRKAFLFLEGVQEGQLEPVEAQQMADLLTGHQVPIAIINACQSGKQTGSSEASLGSRLMAAGLQVVLAMGYSVTVSAAQILMTSLYRELFAGTEPAAAIRRGRVELHRQKSRRAHFNQTINLEDWVLPVVYENRAVQLATRPFTGDESAAHFNAQAARYRAPDLTYGFVGRDLDILRIERRLLDDDGNTGRNILLVRGMGGAGKTTLLRHLGEWWQTTGLVDEVFFFGYDEKAWNRQQLLHAIAQRILPRAEFYVNFEPLGLEAQQAMLADKLRAARHLLILDNLESITGAEMAIRHTLPPDEQAALHSFLRALAGGKTLVLLGSRSAETWLATGTFGDNVHDLGGLDPEAASLLADKVLARHKAERHRSDPRFPDLLKLLAGFPLAIEVVLANLAQQTPQEVLDALQAGDVKLDDKAGSQDRTSSILKCIDYSHSNLAPADQQLLLCLFPFTSVIFAPLLEQYADLLRQQPALADLPMERLAEVVQQAVNWGLLSPREDIAAFLTIQPTLPYFLRSRVRDAGQDAKRQAIESAFFQLYRQVGKELQALLESKDPSERRLGLTLVGLDYENLAHALDLALTTSGSTAHIYDCLFRYFANTQEHHRALALAGRIVSWSERQPAGSLTAAQRREVAVALVQMGSEQTKLKLYNDAEASYRRTLVLLGDRNQDHAVVYHQLGIVAQEQRRWEEAEGHYRQALAIYVDFNDRYSQAITYHQLGMVAQEQRRWEEAEGHYRQALALKVEFGDRYSQAITYHQLGMVAQEQRRWEEAEGHYRQALAIYVDFNDRYEQAGTYGQLGILAHAQRRWEEAEGHYRQALALFVEFGDRYSQASTYHQLGVVAQERRRWEEAEGHYRQALALCVEFGDRYSQARTYHQLGKVAQEQRRWEEAREYFLKDLEITAQSNDPHGLAITLRSLARLRQATNDDTLPDLIANVLGTTPEQVTALLRQALGSDGAEEPAAGDNT